MKLRSRKHSKLFHLFHHRPLRRQLPAWIQRLVPREGIEKAGVIDVGLTRIHVIDTPDRALVVRSFMGLVRSCRFTSKSHDTVMRRYARIVSHQPYMQGDPR